MIDAWRAPALTVCRSLFVAAAVEWFLIPVHEERTIPTRTRKIFFSYAHLSLFEMNLFTINNNIRALKRNTIMDY
jgi:hypothetical protein